MINKSIGATPTDQVDSTKQKKKAAHLMLDSSEDEV